MKIIIILAHPDKASFNHAIANITVETLEAKGHEVIFSDLYDEEFSPLLFSPEIPQEAKLPTYLEKHCQDLKHADGIVIIHPNWWGQPPAILKGWLDRVLRPDQAYQFQEGDKGIGVPIGLLNASHAIVFNTSNTPHDRETEAFGDPLEGLWKRCVFDFCGVKDFHRRNFSSVVISTPEQRHEWLEEVQEIVDRYF
jgi:NAD(P)H dehydrogenase (quinone)